METLTIGLLMIALILLLVDMGVSIINMSRTKKVIKDLNILATFMIKVYKEKPAVVQDPEPDQEQPAIEEKPAKVHKPKPAKTTPPPPIQEQPAIEEKPTNKRKLSQAQKDALAGGREKRKKNIAKG